MNLTGSPASGFKGTDQKPHRAPVRMPCVSGKYTNWPFVRDRPHQRVVLGEREEHPGRTASQRDDENRVGAGGRHHASEAGDDQSGFVDHGLCKQVAARHGRWLPPGEWHAQQGSCENPPPRLAVVLADGDRVVGAPPASAMREPAPSNTGPLYEGTGNVEGLTSRRGFGSHRAPEAGGDAAPASGSDSQLSCGPHTGLPSGSWPGRVRPLRRTRVCLRTDRARIELGAGVVRGACIGPREGAASAGSEDRTDEGAMGRAFPHEPDGLQAACRRPTILMVLPYEVAP